MKKRNQSTFSTYHNSISNSNNTNNTNYNNTAAITTINNNNNNNSYNQNTYTQQEQIQSRQHSNRNRCQIIPPQQFLLPTQSQQHTKINSINYQQVLPTETTTKTTTIMSSLTTSNYLQNQFTNQQQYTPYLNNQQYQTQTYQQQYPNINRNQLIQQQQQMLQQQNHNQQQQQSELQYQKRQQLQLPLFSQNNTMQQFQQNQQHQRRQLFEQQQIANTTVNSVNANSNNNNNNNHNNNASINNNKSTPANGNDNEKFSMDATEIANFLANELFMQQLVSVDGIQSGVPTLTTSTLTPTLLKSIEETFTQLIEEPIQISTPIQAPFQAGFKPPIYPSTSNNTTNNIDDSFNGSVNDFNDTESEDSQNSLGRPMYEGYALGGETTDNSSATTDSTSFQNGPHKSSFATSNSNSASTNDFSSINVAFGAAAGKKSNNNANTSPSATTSTGTTTTRRNQGGRRPAKPSNLTPEEEEKRRIRRERNKLAAARCRKRRVDLTNDLLDEVSQLERKRDVLQKEIATLNTQKQELEYIFEAHRPNCQKIIKDLMSVTTYNGLIAPNTTTTSSNDNSDTITGIDTTLASTGRSSPIDLKPEIIHDNILGITHIKNEPIDSTLDGNSLDHDGPPSPKRMLLSKNNPMIPPPLPKIGTLSPSLAAASLNTPIVTTAPVSFANFSNMHNTNTLHALNKPLLNIAGGSKQRPTTLPTLPRNAAALGINVDTNKASMDINGVAIQTPSTGMFNFDSLMDGGTGLTPVSGPLVPTCSSQNKHPLELTTPTSEPSKLVSL